MIFFGSVFDFLDGTVARLLKVNNPIGKDLDSLADMVTFVLAPSFMLFVSVENTVLRWSVFILVAFGALRLARFNNDPAQKYSFKGVPTPAMALFFVSYVLAMQVQGFEWLGNDWLIAGLAVLFGLLMVSPLGMLSLKFRNPLDIKENLWRYVFLSVALVLIIVFKFFGLALAVVWYVVLSLFVEKA